MSKKYIATRITTLSQKEYIKFRIFDQMEIDYFSLIKGFILNPPISNKKDEDSISIYCFFVNEFETAKIFKIVCEKLMKKEKLTSDLVLNRSESGHSEIESKSLTKYLKENNFEEKTSIFEPENYFSQNQRITDNQNFSFLLGNYIRFYKDEKFILLDCWKNYVLLSIIKSFCIGNDLLKTETHFGVPDVTHIKIDQESVLLEYLKIWSKKIVE